VTNLLRRVNRAGMGLYGSRRGSRSITTIDDYLAAVESMNFGGTTYPIGTPLNSIQQTQGPLPHERIRDNFVSYAAQVYGGNSVVFALMAVRQLAFSAVRFQWQQLSKGRPDKLFGTPGLGLLEEPWAGGTTQDLLAKMITDADLAGNSYWTQYGGELVRLRPDWVDILLEERQVPTLEPETGRPSVGTLGWKKVGYLYHEGGRGQSNRDPVVLLPHEVAHFAPLTDPEATYRGMSWLTPLIREVAADNSMINHRRRFMSNAATPNLVIKHDPGVTPADAKLFKQLLDMEYGGEHNAYRTMHIGGGADVQVVGADFKQMDFKVVQGAGESRMAAAAGVPPIIPGFSEGLASATYSNYGQALRRFAGLTMHPLWQSASGSLQRLFKPPPGTRLWYDTRDVAFLREDAKDLSEIQQTQAATISSYISAGFTPDSAAAAVRDDDISLLEHTGLISVQLWTPTAQDDSKKTGGETDGGDEPDATPPQEQGQLGGDGDNDG
jgi:hypothetical protein